MALWWKFQLPGLGTHHLRAARLCEAGQEIYLDGTPLDAPPGTTTFTGPGACLLELQRRPDTGEWALMVDGMEVQPAPPAGASSGGGVPAPAPPPGEGALWWKLLLPGAGSHFVRVTAIGTPAQQLVIDGVPVEAPEGTLAFTGPAGSFLELRPCEDGSWALLADGSPQSPHDPCATAEPPLSWSFSLPTGTHLLQALHLGTRGQEISLDGAPIVAPEGELAFTGPGGALLQLVPAGSSRWDLLVDGAAVEAATVPRPDRCGDGIYVFSCQGRTHQLQAVNMGGSAEQVFLDGALIPAPPGTTCFTGPGGCLLELKPEKLGWTLYMDGSCVAVGEDPVSAPPPAAAAAPAPEQRVRMPLPVVRASIAPTAAQSLPQGVSLDSSTGMYTANIRVGGKFRFLGEFSTPQEASERYQQARRGK